MVAAGVVRAALRVAPTATLTLLGLWAFADILGVPDARWSESLLTILGAGFGILVFAAALRSSWVRPIGLGCVGASYFATHTFVLGVQVGPALLYLTLLIAHVELRILRERFAFLYAAQLGSVARRRIRNALARAVSRLIVASALAIVVPILAANLAVAGIVPATTIPTAILLAAALVAVVFILALLPILERRVAESVPRGSPGTKDN